MAITINVGGSKKASVNYQSTGVSLNVTAEVPNDALTEPQKIADTANDLFELVNRLLDEQIAKASRSEARSTNGTGTRPREGDAGNGRRQTNGRGRYGDRSRSNGNGRGTGSNQNRGLTQAQERAIHTMARRLDRGADEWTYDEFGVDGVKNLSVKQASEMIDLLKAELDNRPTAEEVR